MNLIYVLHFFQPRCLGIPLNNSVNGDHWFDWKHTRAKRTTWKCITSDTSEKYCWKHFIPLGDINFSTSAGHHASLHSSTDLCFLEEPSSHMEYQRSYFSNLAKETFPSSCLFVCLIIQFPGFANIWVWRGQCTFCKDILNFCYLHHWLSVLGTIFFC